jgi:outer membrane protein assembly factor BamB
MTRTRLLSALACLLGLVLTSLALSDTPSSPAHWAQWRGPSGQGYADDPRVPLTWSEKQNLVWKTKLPGSGNSTPIVWGDRIFLTAASHDGRTRSVICVKASDGKVLWQQVATEGEPGGKTHEWNGYASASCTTDGSHVYAFFGTPGLFCYDLDGKLLWKHRFGIFTSATGWGTAASPFLYDDLVIQNCDNDGDKALPAGHKPDEAAPQALVALDKKTGRVVWTTPRDQGRGFSTPCLIPTAGGRIDLVLNGPEGLWGYDPRTGKELWRCTRSDPKEAHHFGEPMPVFDNQGLFVMSGRPGPCQAIRLPGSVDVTRSNLIWDGVRKGRDVGSPLLWQGLIYAADKTGLLTCLDFKTGKGLYTERLGGQVLASPVLVRGRLLFLTDTGVTVVLQPGPRFKVEARNKLGDGGKLDFGASPVVADGRLYLRSQSYLYSIGETK